LHKSLPNKRWAVQKFAANDKRGNIVTVLLQDYFHRGVFKSIILERQWKRIEGQLDGHVDATLKLLDDFNIKATFFTLGWIAEHSPEIIKRIASERHEIASAGYWARSIREMSPDQFREDIRRSRHALEQAGANRVVGYRNAYLWLREKDFWALEILREEGFLYDAGFRPALFDFNGKSCKRYVHRYQTKSGDITEIPAATHPICGMNLPISGGNYLRQFPHSIMFRCYRSWCRNTSYPFVLYFHPWELDKHQPQINAIGRFGRLKQYRNLGKMTEILPRYFQEAKFQSASAYLGISLEYSDASDSVSSARTSTIDSHSSSPAPDAHRTAWRVNHSKLKSEKVLPRKPVTILIPCFNEGSSLPYLARALEELKIQGRDKYSFIFLFLDDCSSDDTVSKLQDLYSEEENCKIVRHDQNMGIAAALHTGFKFSETEIVCSIDADCSYDPLDLLEMIPLLKDGVDMVTASPYHLKGNVLGVPGWRLILSKTLSNIYHVMLNHKMSTYTSCFRVYRRSSVSDINITRGDFRGIIELLARLDFCGGKIVEYPTTLQSRIFGFSKMKVLRLILGHLKLLFELMSIKWSNKLRSEN